MQLFQHTIWLARTPEQVFDFFTDFSVAPRWRSFVRTMEVEGGGPPRVGSRLKVVMDVAGDEYVYTMQVLACERPSLWRHKTNETDFDGHIEYRFDAENGGTRVTMTGTAKPISLYGWLAMPQLFLVRGKSYREQLPQLKRALEGGA
jgi:uncharacterized protein YndB with AHSA1/START domain